MQAALVELQSQQLAWKHDNLSERLAALLKAAPQASLNTSAKVHTNLFAHHGTLNRAAHLGPIFNAPFSVEWSQCGSLLCIQLTLMALFSRM